MVWICTLAFMAKTEVQIMGGNHANHCYTQKDKMIGCELFGCQKEKAKSEQADRLQGVVVFPVSVREGIGADQEGQSDHDPFKGSVMNDVEAHQRQAGQHKR